MYETHVHKKGVHFLSCRVWDPTLHYLNRNHVLLLSPLNFVFRIPVRRLRMFSGCSWHPDPCHVQLALCGLGGLDHKNTILIWCFCGCWCCCLGYDDSQQVPSWCTSRCYTAVLLVNITVYKNNYKLRTI